MNAAIISERIRQKRKAKGLTQAELADALGMSEMTVRRWEGGKSSPWLEEISMLSRELETSADYLMGLDGNVKSENKEERSNIPSMAYWGAIVDNARLVARDGQNLGLIYSLLSDAAGTVKAAMA